MKVLILPSRHIVEWFPCDPSCLPYSEHMVPYVISRQGPGQDMDDQIYSRLRKDQKEIRLIKLRPGTISDLVSCELFKVSLEDGPVYEALSYVWGDPKITSTISVNGIEVQATTNLEAALRHLRLQDGQRTIWVDAICINQSNIEERNTQVGMMRDIYALATSVEIWLGGRSEESDRALDLIQILSRLQHIHEFSSSAIDPDEISTGDHILDEDFFKPLDMLIQNPLWQRIWIVQEVALSRKAFLRYGQRILSWDTFAMASAWANWHEFCCARYKYTSLEALANVYALRSIAFPHALFQTTRDELAEMGGSAFPWILNTTRKLKATDDRDKVYGVLGLASSALIDVDYKLTVTDLYQKVTLAIIMETCSFAILSSASFSHQVLTLPSWTVDWTFHDNIDFEGGGRGQPEPVEAKYNACGSLSTADFSFSHDGGSLELSGVCLTSISQIANKIPARSRATQSGENALEEIFRNMAAMLASIGQPVDLADDEICLNDTFWGTLISDLILDAEARQWRRSRPSDREIYAPWRQVWKQRLESGSMENMDPDIHSFGAAITTAHVNRRIFRTSSQHLGIAPSAAEVGDLVWILKGGPVPFILRPVVVGDAPTGAPSKYRLVGTAYVHGVMDGEAMKDYEDGKQSLQTLRIV
jgi:hypothetical protein